MLLARRIGAVLLAFAAGAVWFLLEPDATPSASGDFGPDIAAALDSYDVNNRAADSAPQQEVVNGWAAKDLLTVIARAENAGLSTEPPPLDERIPAELLLLVLGVALIAITTPRPKVEPDPVLSTRLESPRRIDGPPPTRTTEATPTMTTRSANETSTSRTSGPLIPMRGPENTSRPGRGRLAILVSAGVVTVLAVTGLVVWASITSPADATCKELASNRLVAADDAYEQMPDGDLRDDLEGIAQLGVDAERLTTDQATLFPPTFTSRQQFVDARTDILDQVWTVCEDETVGFPSDDSRYYDNVRNDVIKAAEYRWDHDGG